MNTKRDNVATPELIGVAVKLTVPALALEGWDHGRRNRRFVANEHAPESTQRP
jgi:hypothetical protein